MKGKNGGWRKMREREGKEEDEDEEEEEETKKEVHKTVYGRMKLAQRVYNGCSFCLLLYRYRLGWRTALAYWIRT